MVGLHSKPFENALYLRMPRGRIKKCSSTKKKLSHLENLYEKREEIRQSTALLPSPFTTINYTSPMIPVDSPSLEASNTNGSLFLHSGHHQMYCLDGNQIINLKNLKSYIKN